MRWWMLPALLIQGTFALAVCKCPETNDQEQTELASQIFVGFVDDIVPEKGSAKKTIVFDVDDSYKGDPTDPTKVTDDAAGTDCALDFKLNERYVVYTRWQWGDILTSQCFGTRKEEPKVVTALGASDSDKEEMYPMLEKACMGHAAIGCCLNSVKAMRKGHYLPIPEKGCPEDMLPDRLMCFTSYTWCIPSSEYEHRHNTSVTK